ncbi:MAG: hypothetical protein ACJ8D6_00030 [Sphingomicrobium sp.]
MASSKLHQYPALQKFISLYWHQNAVLLYGSFGGALEQFRKDATGHPETARLYDQCLEELKKAFADGAIRKKLPQTVQVEFWGRKQPRVSLSDYEEIFGKQESAE